MNQIKQKAGRQITYRELLDIALVTLFTAYCFLPSLNKNYKWYYVTVFIVVYMTCNVLFDKKVQIALVPYVCAFLVLSILYSWIIDQNVSRMFFSRLSSLLQCFFPFFVAMKFLRRNQVLAGKILFATITIIWLYVLVITWRELQINPRVCRTFMVSISENDGYQALSPNIGGYNFVMAIIGVFVILLAFALRLAQKKRWRLLSFAVCVVLVIFLLKAQYTIAILAVLLAVVLLFVEHTLKSLKFFLVICFLIISLFLPNIFRGLATLFPTDNDISKRLLEVADISSFSYSQNTTYDRWDIYLQALQTILNSPIWGNAQITFDPHGTFLNLFTKLGLIGLLPYLYIFIHSKNLLSKQLHNTPSKSVLRISFVVFLFVGFLNPIYSAYPLNLIMWLYIPLGILITQKPFEPAGTPARSTPEKEELIT